MVIVASKHTDKNTHTQKLKLGAVSRSQNSFYFLDLTKHILIALRLSARGHESLPSCELSFSITFSHIYLDMNTNAHLHINKHWPCAHFNTLITVRTKPETSSQNHLTEPTFTPASMETDTHSIVCFFLCNMARGQKSFGSSFVLEID